jgi:deoxyadenosine/deoxycytidine kinase
MIIEIIGVAGAGKSTLTNALAKRIKNIQIEMPPSYRKAENIPFFAHNSLAIFPILPRIFLRRRRHPIRYHIVLTVILNGWHRLLNQKALKGESVFILDQGPIYMIAFENLFGPEMGESNSSKKYWDHAYRCWAETLEVVIWLDAALPVLVDRIRTRETRHTVKSVGDQDAYQYLETYRQAYESVVSRMNTVSGSLKVLRLDTGENSLDMTVERVIHELHLEDG